MIGGMMKYYRLGFEEILYGISYSNILLLSASIPNYGKGGKDDDVTIKGDDPANNALLSKILT